MFIRGIMKNILGSVLLFGLIGSSVVMAKDNFKTWHVKDLDAALKSTTLQLFIYDANPDSTRMNAGIIPNARLLSSSSDYSLSDLPQDKAATLVFYCANTMCTASHTAAERAIKAGYTKVFVMVDGIFGWKKAGKQTAMAKWNSYAIAPTEVFEMMKKKQVALFDVREGEERYEIVDQSQWAPLSKIGNPSGWSEFVKGLPKDKLVVFYCASGMRSRQVSQRLASEGFKTAYFQSPDQWRAEGLPVKSGPAR